MNNVVKVYIDGEVTFIDIGNTILDNSDKINSLILSVLDDRECDIAYVQDEAGNIIGTLDK